MTARQPSAVWRKGQRLHSVEIDRQKGMHLASGPVPETLTPTIIQDTGCPLAVGGKTHDHDETLNCLGFGQDDTLLAGSEIAKPYLAIVVCHGQQPAVV